MAIAFYMDVHIPQAITQQLRLKSKKQRDALLFTF